MSEAPITEAPIKTSKNRDIQNQVDNHVRKLSKKRQTESIRDLTAEARDKVASELRMDRVRKELDSAKEDAMKDKLTGLPNRRHMEDILAVKAAEATRKGTLFKVGIIDVDRFKMVNDTFGHGVGDQILQVLATLDRREEETMGRWGGEEFLVVLDGDTDIEGLSHMFTRLSKGMETKSQEILAQQENKNADMKKVTFSMGVADYIPGVTSVDEMIKRADEALYAAKNGGRDTLVYAMPFSEEHDSQSTYYLQPVPKMKIDLKE